MKAIINSPVTYFIFTILFAYLSVDSWMKCLSLVTRNYYVVYQYGHPIEAPMTSGGHGDTMFKVKGDITNGTINEWRKAILDDLHKRGSDATSVSIKSWTLIN